MIYQVHALVRLPGLTPAAFQDHWLERHAPLVKRLAADLRIKSYRQLHTLPDPAGREARYDGYAIVGFEGLDDFAAMLGSVEGRAAARLIREDEKLFFDGTASIVTWTTSISIM
jgi:uncharacterized protein (TIGR02118 family)